MGTSLKASVKSQSFEHGKRKGWSRITEGISAIMERNSSTEQEVRKLYRASNGNLHNLGEFIVEPEAKNQLRQTTLVSSTEASIAGLLNCKFTKTANHLMKSKSKMLSKNKQES